MAASNQESCFGDLKIEKQKKLLSHSTCSTGRTGGDHQSQLPNDDAKTCTTPRSWRGSLELDAYQRSQSGADRSHKKDRLRSGADGVSHPLRIIRPSKRAAATR